ncbi:MAG: dienelactone hydrolase family protein [Verrucomicrobiales bacterium]
MHSFLLLWFVLLAASPALGAIRTKVIEYKIGPDVFEGFLAYDDTAAGAHPGVLIVHQWKGLGEYEQKRAEMVAKLGYVAFCADIYGKGVRPTGVKDASAMAGKYKEDRTLYRERLKAALDVLAAQPQVEKGMLAAMGYCFGGTGALEVARSGAEVRGVISFHGGLGTPTPGDANAVKGRVLVLHGADDPFVPPAEVDGFKKEMDEAGVRYEFVAYPGAVHSFTHWTAGDDPSKGAAYHKEADEKSWVAMQKFFKAIFSK